MPPLLPIACPSSFSVPSHLSLITCSCYTFSIHYLLVLQTLHTRSFIPTASTYRLPILLLNSLAPLSNYLLLLHALYTLPAPIANSAYTFLTVTYFVLEQSYSPLCFALYLLVCVNPTCQPRCALSDQVRFGTLLENCNIVKAGNPI